MITVTLEAAKQIRFSAQQDGMENLPLRIAATRNTDGSIDYAMGFDDVGGDNDKRILSKGIELVIDLACLPSLKGTVLDYGEIEPGSRQFVFINPNDSNCNQSP